MVDSAKQRLKRVVIGGNKAGRHDFRSFVGKKSSAQEESEEAKMAAFTSAYEKGWKLDRGARGEDGGMWAEIKSEYMPIQRWEILSLKSDINDEASRADDV